MVSTCFWPPYFPGLHSPSRATAGCSLPVRLGVFIYPHGNDTLQSKVSSAPPLRPPLPPTQYMTASLLALLAMMIRFLSRQSVSQQRSENKHYKAYELFLGGFLINSTWQVFVLRREIVTAIPPQLKES